MSKGYRLYYDLNEKKFKYDITESEVQSIKYGETSAWFTDVTSAKNACETRNTKLHEIRICKYCGTPYFFTDEDKEFYDSMKFNYPV